MSKKNLLKATSVFTAFALACSTMTGCGMFNKTEESAVVLEEETEEDKEADELVETMNKTAFTGSTKEAERGKEETVYVMTDANGAVDEVVVSNWLKNADNSKTITDKTNLKDIVNVKGDESYTDNGDGTVTWDAEGSDIYYQGTPSQELPIGVKVTYSLDGKELSADEIAGKSGKVKIRFDYTNTLTKEVEIDGKKENIDVPFTMISGTMLDNDKFANVKVSKGKVVSDANSYVVVGVAMPGLKESLKIDDAKLEENDINKEDVDIPDYVEITADVNNFELPMTISMASANVVSDLGLDKIYDSDKIGTLNDDMDELSDASTKLRDGSGELADGTTEFADGTKELKEGTTELRDGAKELKDGTSELRSGAGELASGAGTLASGTGTLSTGIVSYTEAVGTIAAGAGTLDDGVGTLKSGTKDLTKGIGSAKDGAKDLSTGAAQLSTGIDTAANAVKSNLDAVSSAANTFYSSYKPVIDAAESANSKAVLNSAYSQADTQELNALMNEIVNALGTIARIEAENGVSYSDDDSYEQPEEDEAVVAQETAEADSEDSADAQSSDNADAQSSSETSQETEAQDDESSSSDSSSSDSSSTSDASSSSDSTPASDEGSSDNSEAGSQDTTDTAGTEQNADDSVAEADNTQQEAEENSEEKADTSDEAPAEENNSEEGSTEDAAATEPEQVTLGSSADEPVSGMEQYSDTDWAFIQSQTGMSKSDWDAKFASAAKYTVYQSNLVTAATEMQNYGNQAQQTIGAVCQGLGISGITEENIAAVVQNGIRSQNPADIAALTKGLAGALGYTSQALQTAGGMSADIQGLAQSASDMTVIYMTYKTLSSSKGTLDQLYNGTGSGGLKDIQTGAQQLATGANSLYSGMKKLDKGGDKLFEGVKDLKEGTGKLAEGTKTLNSNSSALTDGASKLADGATQLADGASKLSDGTVTLDDGVSEFNDGIIRLDDGAAELNNGAGELNDGAKKLADGMVEFDEDGIQKLTSTVDDDLVSVTDRLRAVDEASQSYTTFSGANDDEPSSVQFIIRTAGISADED